MSTLLRRRSCGFIAFLIAAFTLLLVYFRSAAGTGLGFRSRLAESKHDPHYNKTLVVASIKGQDTSWVYTDLPDWNPVIYVVDDPEAPFYTGFNKGNEANPYLHYIIQNYDFFPQSTVFVHHHIWSNHLPKEFTNTSDMIRHLSLRNLQHEGYISLSCLARDNCDVQEIDLGNSALYKELKEPWPEIFPSSALPKIVTGYKSGQFAVSRAQVHARPLSDYQHWHKWLEHTELDSYYSGRTFEYVWHMIFGKPPQFCKSKEDCFCDGFEICDLKAHRLAMGLKAVESF